MKIEPVGLIWRMFRILAVIAIIPFYSFSQHAKNEQYQWPSDSMVKAKLEQWQDWKFGVIIHWGPYSEWGVVESWSLCPEDEPWCIRRGPYADSYSGYVNAYEKIRKTFNPTAFNPEQWASACREAGMKYVVFTTKHHDGFCMYDSKETSYTITNPPSAFADHPRSNITQEVFTAFRGEGLAAGVYFSKPDWHNDDYWWPYFPVFDRNVNYDPQKYPERWQRFVDFTYQQIEELMTGYGSVDILWLDGGWVRPAGTLTEETAPWLGKNQWVQDVNMPAIAAMARSHQPGLLIVDRTVHGDFENYRTPEQQIPHQKPDYPWESCITLGNSWYHSGPAEQYKSATWAIHTLIRIVAKGGNLLLGVGPDNSGAFPPEVYHRLTEIGQWMDINSEAIYSTRPLYPYQEGDFCFTVSNDNRNHYAHLLLKEGQPMPKNVELPATIPANIKKIQLIGYNKPLTIKRVKGVAIISIPGEIQKSPAFRHALVFKW
jgi:alpha-L-fucosidase